MEPLSDENIEAKAQAVVDGIDALLVEQFGPPSDENHVHIVIGLNVGDALILSTNLTPCAAGPAIRDLYDMAAQQHDAYHAEDGPAPYMDTTDLSGIPEDVLAQARALAEAHGVPFEDIVYRKAVDTTDVTDEGLAALIGTPFDPTADPEPGERPVLTGDDDISNPQPTAKDIRDLGVLGDTGDDTNEV